MKGKTERKLPENIPNNMRLLSKRVHKKNKNIKVLKTKVIK